jgi:hypothetical protein
MHPFAVNRTPLRLALALAAAALLHALPVAAYDWPGGNNRRI